MDEANIKDMVRARYAGIADAGASGCCGPAASPCCGPAPASHFDDKALGMGYSEAELASVAEGAIFGSRRNLRNIEKAWNGCCGT
jgi:hypothetical protein